MARCDSKSEVFSGGKRRKSLGDDDAGGRWSSADGSWRKAGKKRPNRERGWRGRWEERVRGNNADAALVLVRTQAGCTGRVVNCMPEYGTVPTLSTYRGR